MYLSIHHHLPPLPSPRNIYDEPLYTIHLRLFRCAAGLFSATQTEAVEALARAGLRNPVRVNVAVTLAQPPPCKKQKREKGEWGSRVVLLAGYRLVGCPVLG